MFQHNTMVSAASTPCWGSIYSSGGSQKPPFFNLTNNVWILDNVLCRQPTGDWQLQGTSGLMQYMGAPDDSQVFAKRFYGNVMYIPSSDRVQIFPPHNLASPKAFKWRDATKGDYELTEPKWKDSSDGRPPGIDFSTLPSIPQ